VSEIINLQKYLKIYMYEYEGETVTLLFFILTANGVLTGNSGTTVRHNTQLTHITQKTHHAQMKQRTHCRTVLKIVEIFEWYTK
jgi:hypothetical protein